jgi:hypothetical protein
MILFQLKMIGRTLKIPEKRRNSSFSFRFYPIFLTKTTLDINDL